MKICKYMIILDLESKNPFLRDMLDVFNRVLSFLFNQKRGKWKLLSRVQLFTTHGLYSPWNSPSLLEWVAVPISRDLPNPGIKPRSPTLQVDSLPDKPPGKPKNTGVGSLSLLQWIVPTQEWNLCILHCSWILYQLSYQRSSGVGSHVMGNTCKCFKGIFLPTHNHNAFWRWCSLMVI